jgi:hypothetical protein
MKLFKTLSLAILTGSILALTTASSHAVLAYAVANDGRTLISFDLSTPTLVTTIGNFSGATTFMSGLDFRPANGLLYGYDQTTNRVVTVNLATAATTLASTPTTASNNINTGIDFNPVADRLRVVNTADQNLRIDVATGTTTVDGPLAYAVGDVAFGQNPSIIEVAYTNSDNNAATGTTLYYIDSVRDTLVRTINPNAGELLTVGALGFNTDGYTGFDILSDGLGGNQLFATLTVGGVEGLYTIDSTTGAASLLGAVNANLVYGLAIVQGTLQAGVPVVGGSSPIPEPTTALFGAALLGVVGLSRRRTK